MSIPILYILADAQPHEMKVPESKATERASSQKGTPKGILASITIGDVKGIMEPQNTIGLSGALKA